MRVLALDLATSTGWACGAPGRPISHGVIRMPKTGPDIGRFCNSFRAWLGAAIEDMAPGKIFYEMPILPAQTALMTVRKLNGLTAYAEGVALDYKVPIEEANLSDIRKHFVGVVRAPKEIAPDRRRQWIKDRVCTECRSRGFRVAGDDDADAIALLAFALSLQQPGYQLHQADVSAEAA